MAAGEPAAPSTPHLPPPLLLLHQARKHDLRVHAACNLVEFYHTRANVTGLTPYHAKTMISTFERWNDKDGDEHDDEARSRLSDVFFVLASTTAAKKILLGEGVLTVLTASVSYLDTEDTSREARALFQLVRDDPEAKKALRAVPSVIEALEPVEFLDKSQYTEDVLALMRCLPPPGCEPVVDWSGKDEDEDEGEEPENSRAKKPTRRGVFDVSFFPGQPPVHEHTNCPHDGTTEKTPRCSEPLSWSKYDDDGFLEWSTATLDGHAYIYDFDRQGNARATKCNRDKLLRMYSLL